MMLVDLEKCTGCRECLEACSTGAISMVEGKAIIDFDNCLSCGACADACPQGAISEASLPVPLPTADLQRENVQSAVPVTINRPQSCFPWAMPVISFVGREIIPRAVDSLIAALDRRLSASSTAQVASTSRKAGQRHGGRRQMRQRRRGNKF